MVLTLTVFSSESDRLKHGGRMQSYYGRWIRGDNSSMRVPGPRLRRFASVYRHFRDIGEFMTELRGLLDAKD